MKAILIIKKSTNVHAWQNEFVGRKVLAEITHDGYVVNFADNEHLKVNKTFVQGKLDHEDYNTIEAKEDLSIKNPNALR